jgi:hypothetical protein
MSISSTMSVIRRDGANHSLLPFGGTASAINWPLRSIRLPIAESRRRPGSTRELHEALI